MGRRIMKQRVKLDDIAKKAGVSKMAVSLALRDDPSIGKDTIKMIREIANSLGYVPNSIAKSLASGKTNTIAAIVGGEMHDDYHNQFLKGAIEYATLKGYTLTIGLTENDKKLEANLINKFHQMMIEGFLLFHCNNISNYQLMKQLGIPFVLYTKYFNHLDSDYVVCDDVKGGYMMTKHFLSLDHKRIAFVYDIGLEKSSEVLNRIKGYKKALEESKVEFDPELVLPYYYSFNNSDIITENTKLLQCLKSKDAPTAMFVCNDVVASAFYITIKSMGYKIPEDLSVGGYEGIFLGAVLDPPLTTISTPIREMGRTACELLINKIEGKISPEVISKLSLEPVLTIRNSTLKR